jgi:hypothetical protein
MRPNSLRQPKATGKFLRNHSLGVIAEDDMKFVLARTKIVQQALSINHSTGAGDGDDEFQREK